MHYLWLLALLAAGNLYASQAVDLNVGESIALTRIPHDQINIKIDGHLDEATWQQASVITDFTVIEPDTMAKPRWKTRLMLIYTERGIYAGYDMEQPRETITSVLAPRDAGLVFGDFIGLTLDTSGDGKYGYWIGLSASGVKTDGTLIPEAQFLSDWDGVWLGETSITESGWAAEVFIPWSQLAMPKQQGKRRISVFASRRLAAIGERWGVPALPFTVTNWIRRMRPMELQDIDPRQQWSMIPYASVSQDQIGDSTKLRAGAEMFWRPSTNFQLSATLLPDFGNVESDDVVVNLSALETFFPEKRLFFLEGRDIFITSPRSDSRGNFFPVSIVNTRRIGGAPRPPNLPAGVTLAPGELNQQAELYGAVKATGQIGELRYGLLGASEDETTFAAKNQTIAQSGSDYIAARLFWEQASAGTYRAIGIISTLTTHPEENATVHGLDYHYLTRNGTWKLDGQVLYSDKDIAGKGWGTFADLVYTPRRGLNLEFEIAHFDEKLDINDLGFLQRNDITRAGMAINYTRADVDWARQLNLTARTIYEVNGDGDTTRQGFSASTNVVLNNLGRINTSLLFFGARTDDLESFGNGKFSIPGRWVANVDYFSDTSRPFSYRLGFDIDEEKLGGTAVKARAGFAWRPSLRMTVQMLAEHVRRDGWLLHQEAQNFTTFETKEWRPTLSVDYFFTARQQLRLSTQWIAIQARESDFYRIPTDGNALIPTAKPPGPSDDFTISNLNFQLRYRWQLAPLSDLFVVYTITGLQNPSRASFSRLFKSAFEDPVGEQITVKLRYRFGS